MSFALIVLVIFASIILISTIALGFGRNQRLSSGPAETNSLGTSELQRMIRESVAEAVEPLANRLETIERKALTASTDAESAGEQRSLPNEPSDA